MPHFSSVSDLNAVSAYPATPQVSLQFVPDFYVLRVETGAVGVLVSFDGVNDHLHFKPTDLQIPIHSKATKVWLKEDGAGACTFRVSALSNG